jgi:tetratricopeptide (TPR) repeat protein
MNQTSVLIILAALAFPGAAAAQNMIEGRITTEDGQPAANFPVFLLDDGYQQKGMVYADAGGRFRFSVGKGRYVVKVEPNGADYEQQAISVEVYNPFAGRAAPTHVDFNLRLRDGVKRARPTAPAGAGVTAFAQNVPPAAREAYNKAAQDLGKGDSGKAISGAKEAVRLFPDYVDALELLGTELVKQRKFDDAIAALRHAIQVNPNSWRGHYGLGVSLVETAQRPEGVSELRRAVELNPESPNTNMRLGMELAKDPQMIPDAIRALEKVTAIAGKDIPDAYLYLASLYSKTGQYAKAADALEIYVSAASGGDAAQRAQYRKVIQQLRDKAAK